MLKSLGLVWIPGVMAGMMVSGAGPIYASIYQFIIVAMILAASGFAGLIVTLLLRASAFSAAAQLTLRPGDWQPAPDRLAKRCIRAIAPTAFPLAGNARGMWTYEAPYAAVTEIKDHVAVYPDRVDAIEE
jgi:hypothetical protein